MTSLALTGLDRVMAWGPGDSRIAIGLLDGPVVLRHPDLQAPVVQVQPGACRVAGSAACEHGTLVAGVLGARRGSGAAGIAPGCPLLVRPVFTEDGAPSSPGVLADGIIECVAAGARIIHISTTFTGALPAGAAALAGALDHAARQGVIVVAAAGHQARGGGSPLTSHPWVVPVTSCDEAGRTLPGSNLTASTGRHGLRAPATGVPGLAVGSGTGLLTGPGAAAALVTGAIALAWSADPQVGAAHLRAAVTRHRRRTGVVPPLLNAVAIYTRVTRRRRHDYGR